MKTFTGLFTTLSLGALLLAGCVNEEPPYKNAGNGTTDSTTTGFLSGAMSLRVIYDTETDTQPDDTQDETQTPPSTSSIRPVGICLSFISSTFEQFNCSSWSSTEPLASPARLK